MLCRASLPDGKWAQTIAIAKSHSGAQPLNPSTNKRMEIESINLHNEKITHQLRKENLYGALILLKEFALKADAPIIANKAQTLADNYTFMLEFLKSGGIDPNSQQQRHKFYEEAYLLNDKLADLLYDRENAQKLIYQKRRQCLKWAGSMQTDNLLQSLQLLLSDRYEEEAEGQILGHTSLRSSQIPEHLQEEGNSEDCAAAIFYTLWTTFELGELEQIIVRQLITSDCYKMHHRAIFVSALMLNILQWYSEDKVTLLLDCIDNLPHTAAEEISLCMRAYQSVVLVFYAYKYRIFKSRPLVNRFDSLMQRLNRLSKQPFLLQIHLNINSAKEAEQINSGEIAQSLFSLQQKIKEQMPDASEALPYESLEEIMENPEWSKTPEIKQIRKTFNQIHDLRDRGVDLMFSTFSLLHNIPFFHSLHTWFMPFTPEHLGVKQAMLNDDKKGELVKLIGAVQSFSDSDKYLLIINFKHLQQPLIDQIKQSMNIVGTELPEDLALPTPDAEELWAKSGREFWQTLFRFHRCNRQAEKKFNPFGETPLFTEPEFESYFNTPETLRTLGEYFIRTKQYYNAYLAFLKLSETDQSEDVLQKCAYALDHQSSKNKTPELNEKILKLLQESDRLYPERLWTMRYMADILSKLNRDEEAEKILTRASQLYPEEIRIAIDLAQCLTKLKRYKEAIPHALHADLIRENNKQVQRMLSLCLSMQQDYSRALTYALQRIEQNPASEDWRRAGHIYALCHNIREAVDCYKHSLDKQGEAAIAEWIENIDFELRDYKEQGIDISPLETAREIAIYELLNKNNS